MEKKASLQLLILFLGFSYVLSSVAVPLSRSLVLANEDPSLQDQVLMEQGFIKQDENYAEFLDDEGGFIHGRMIAESSDYPGTGPNNHHDPKPPGKV